LFSVGTGSAVASAPAREIPAQPQKVRPSAFGGRERQKLILFLALVAATLIFYNPVAHDGFILLDDVPYILSNPPVKAGLTWSTVKWAFTTFHAGYWHPLTWLSHALDCELFGLNPAGHHYVSLLFHAANAGLLFLLLEEATALAWPSLIVAAIFALHPLNVESVAWAAERKNVLSLFFFLLALLVYGRYARRSGTWRYVAVNACFVLGMMAKPQIITLPFVLLLWDYWPLKRMFGENHHVPQQHRQWDARESNAQYCVPRSLSYLLTEKIPLFVIMLGGCVLTFAAQRSDEAVRTLGEFSLKTRIANAVVSYAKYLRFLAWPRHLAPMYPHPGNGIPASYVVISCVVLLGLTAIAVWSRQRRYLAMGWLWFLGVLVPMIGIVQVGEQAMADRFVYIPMIGILIAVVWFVWELAEENAISKLWIALPATVIVFVLGAQTYHQLSYWKDGETLWRYTLTVTDGNYMAHDNLAMVLDKEGRVEEAIPEFLKAESLHRYPLPQVLSMGVYLQRHGDIQDAMRMYAKVVSNAPDPHVRSMAWSRIAACDAQLNDYKKASENYQHALEADPSNVLALVGSALVAERNGDLDRAIAQLRSSAKIEPNDMTFLLLEDVLDRAGRANEALAAEQAAEKVSSDMAQSRRNAAEMERFFGLEAAPDAALAK
jgi:protein O-mannosyl-transferase